MFNLLEILKMCDLKVNEKGSCSQETCRFQYGRDYVLSVCMYPSSGAYDIDAWKNIWIYVELREKI